MGCKRCKKTANTPEAVLAKRRESIGHLFDKGNPAAAQKHRWMQCMAASECGLKCPDMDAPANEVPTCNGIDLYAALKRREFECPRGLF